jgi:hypothetical protein
MKIDEFVGIDMRAPRLRAPPEHGGAVCVFFVKYQVLIRRGGVPFWCGGNYHNSGVWGSQPPVFCLKNSIFIRNHFDT